MILVVPAPAASDVALLRSSSLAGRYGVKQFGIDRDDAARASENFKTAVLNRSARLPDFTQILPGRLSTRSHGPRTGFRTLCLIVVPYPVCETIASYRP